MLFADRAFVTASTAPTFGTLVSAGAPAGRAPVGGPLSAAGGGGGLGEGGEEDAGLPPARTLLGAPRGGGDDDGGGGGGGGGGDDDADGAGGGGGRGAGPELLARALARVFARAAGLPVLLGCGVERVGVAEARELVAGVEALLAGLAPAPPGA